MLNGGIDHHVVQEINMTRGRKLLLAGSVAVLVAGGGALAVAKTMPHHWGAGHFGMNGPFGGPMCIEKSNHMDRMLNRMEKLIQPTEAQKPDFEALKAAMQKAQDEVQATCPKDGEMVDRTPPAMLAQMESHLTAMLDGVKTVRPAAEKLYAELTDKQKDRLRWSMPFGGEGMQHHRWMHGDDNTAPEQK